MAWLLCCLTKQVDLYWYWLWGSWLLIAYPCKAYYLFIEHWFSLRKPIDLSIHRQNSVVLFPLQSNLVKFIRQALLFTNQGS